ncbi:ParB/RepB/Spo0J family partition protein [Rhodobacterales bacterium HKCCE2091]|nr:ParB/RepB/Spo0J family partition protein [Rhodobacterales bacterium HKCCE2091]
MTSDSPTPRRDKRGLGRGLSALMADINPASEVDPASAPRPDRLIPIERIRPNPDQPRRSFSQSALEDLAQSIQEKGIIQPLIVRPDPTVADSYQLVAGERRWRAAQLAQLHEVPALVRDFDDTEVLEVAIIENIQRADLNPIEEAMGYRQLMDRFGHTQEKLAQAMGKSRSHIANTLRLTTLPEPVQDMLRAGQLSAGHARALITSDRATELARIVVAKGLSVREAEKLAAGPASNPGSGQKRPHPQKDADTAELERSISAVLKMPVSVEYDAGTGGGRISIRYRDLQQLDDLVQLLGA